MKTDIHPKYIECRVHCSCGNEFTTRSTVPELRVELCSECHPFYTGKQKLVDTGGRVERFERRYAKSSKASKKKLLQIVMLRLTTKIRTMSSQNRELLIKVRILTAEWVIKGI